MSVNTTTTDSGERNRDTEEPGAGNLLAQICGCAGQATPRLYTDIYPEPQNAPDVSPGIHPVK